MIDARICPTCGRPVVELEHKPQGGRPAEYCSATCRQLFQKRLRLARRLEKFAAFQGLVAEKYPQLLTPKQAQQRAETLRRRAGALRAPHAGR
jgi:hypothetical protein